MRESQLSLKGKYILFLFAINSQKVGETKTELIGENFICLIQAKQYYDDLKTVLNESPKMDFKVRELGLSRDI